MDIFEKCAKATEYESELKESGYYFFFRKLESPQDSEVMVNGKRVIMIGSNNYLGLTNHPRVKEAALKAVEKYGREGGKTAGSDLTEPGDMTKQDLHLHEVKSEQDLMAFIRI